MPSILLVARQEEDVEALRRALLENGYAVTVAAGGFYALTLLERHRPDVLLSWGHTGDLPGDELCSIIRGDPAMTDLRLLLLGKHLSATAPPGVVLVSSLSTPGDILLEIRNALDPQVPESDGPAEESSRQESQGDISGGLDVVPIAYLLRLLASERSSGCLRFRFRSGTASVSFWEGRLVDSQFGVMSGELAFEEIIREADADPTATFRFDTQASRETLDFPVTISSSLEQLLLNVTARIDRRRGRTQA